jgi:CheY-like chemotaxis protein
MKCPRCNSTVSNEPNAQGIVTCLQCGARLRKSPVSAMDSGAMPDIDSLLARSEPTPAFNPNATLPPGTPLKRIPRPGDPGAPYGASVATPIELPAVAPEPASPVPVAAAAPLEAVLAELRVLRMGQEEILGLLRRQPAAAAPPAEAGPDDDEAPSPPPPPPAPLRSRRRKTVLLIDDDTKSRAAAVACLEQAQVPVRTAADGQSGLSAIAAERPDVIALELGMSGSMAGKDVINMIKATMEWVDIPIVLYTRLPVASQKEARIEHGADEFVLKGHGGPESLVAKVIQMFRKTSA